MTSNENMRGRGRICVQDANRVDCVAMVLFPPTSMVLPGRSIIVVAGVLYEKVVEVSTFDRMTG
ncbi:MAG: hypothetical protein HWN68_04805 [Desulfobacterales bacterium]|nr:hypothetical protein [Desulfobacterales bacterium]